MVEGNDMLLCRSMRFQKDLIFGEMQRVRTLVRYRLSASGLGLPWLQYALAWHTKQIHVCKWRVKQCLFLLLFCIIGSLPPRIYWHGLRAKDEWKCIHIVSSVGDFPPPPRTCAPLWKMAYEDICPQAIDIGGHVPPTEKRCRTFAP